MMNKTIKYLLASLLCITLYACSDDDGPKYPLDNIVGKWFVDYSDASQVHYVVIEFSENGKFYEREVLIGLTENLNVVMHGTYRYNGDIEVIEENDYDTRHFYESFRVNSVNSYALDITETVSRSRYQMHRVVGCYDMSPNDTRTFDVGDSSFQPFGYVSCDEQIATVDDSGNICALRHGVTYIRAISANGEAIIEVNVKDMDNLIDNFPKYLGGSIDNFVSAYGANHFDLQRDNGMSLMAYNVNDEYVHEIAAFYYVPRHIYNIQLTIRNSANIEDIVDSFDQKYERLTSTSEDAFYYRGVEGSTYFVVMINKATWSIIFQWSPDELEQWDGLVTASVDDVIRWSDYEFSLFGEGIYRATVNDGVVNTCVISYDENTRDIKVLSLTLNRQISETTVKAWLEERYRTYLSNNVIYYISGSNLIRSEYSVRITKTNAGLVQVNYIK